MGNTLLVKNIGRLVTMKPGKGRDGPLGVIEGAAVRVKGGRIVWIGKGSRIPQAKGPEEIFDVEGGVLMPGLIDCHTHLVHAGSRQQEFNRRSQGVSYLEIARAGGGIMSTVAATRAADADELYRDSSERADEAMSSGTLVLEMKSGYGLDLESELKILEVMRQLKDNHPLRFFVTFLGAHVVPAEYQRCRADYVGLVIDKMLPRVQKAKLCSACDVFVEEGAFSADEARAICKAAKKHGFKIRLHVDQFSDVGGGELAAEVGALNADHLDHISDAGIKAMAKAGVTGVILPGASFFTGGKHYPPARRMIDMGMRVAIATDYNPGTNPSIDLWLAATIAVTQMGMALDEALRGITVNAAAALGVERENGTVEVGKRADLIVLDAPDEYYPLYRYGKRMVQAVIKKGRAQWMDQYYNV